MRSTLVTRIYRKPTYGIWNLMIDALLNPRSRSRISDKTAAMKLNDYLRRPHPFKSNEIWLKYWKKVTYWGVTIAEYMSFYPQLIDLKTRLTKLMCMLRR